MPEIALKDILINARQESFRMQHYYLGVEHLFIGLLQIQGGLASSMIEDSGLTTEYVIDAIRRQMGKGTRQRLWAGMPNSPRADVVLSIANDLALEDNRQEISERDLLLAIFEENDSIPVRALRKLGLNPASLANTTREHVTPFDSRQPYITIEFSESFEPADALTEQHLLILRRMFYGYSRVRIERQLTGGYTPAMILVVTPIQGDNVEDAAVVVKIDHADTILDEAQRYETHIKSSLPPLTARLEDKPTASETSDVAGLKYTFVAGDNNSARDLRVVAQEYGADGLGTWLSQELYPTFGKTWWMQRRPFRFQVWAEYDWLLPPLLTLDYAASAVAEAMADAEDEQVKVIIKDAARRNKLEDLEYGDLVAVENYTIQRVYRDKNTIQLAIGKGSEAAKRAYKIEVRGLNMANDAYFRGEVVERLIGRVWKTRAEILYLAALALEPDFDVRGDMIPSFIKGEKLPNPIVAYADLMDRYVNGSLSKIHGDLHLGNILMGPNRSPFLIDFAQTRNGHTLFDWACLEVSLLNDVVLPLVDGSWDSARQIMTLVASLPSGRLPPDTHIMLAEAMRPLMAVRRIVGECLAVADNWSEYYIALALCGLRAITWDTLSLGGRRLMFLLSGYAIAQLRSRLRLAGSLDTMSNDDTDVTDF
jgi:hypothetical protein